MPTIFGLADVDADAYRWRWTGASAALFAAMGVIALLVARAPDAFSYPQFFAEDVAVFWTGWRTLGLESFWQPYAGYLHLAPRSIAALVWPLPYQSHPFGFLVFATLGYAWTAATIATTRVHWGLGLAYAFGIMLVPQDGEIWASAVNLQWVMACALPLIASTAAPLKRTARINQLAFLSLAGLSGPFSTFAIPLWVARGVWSVRDRSVHGKAVAAIGLTAGLIQLVFMSTTTLASSLEGTRPAGMGLALFERWGLDYLDVAGIWIGSTLFAFLIGSPIIRDGRWQRLAFLVLALIILSTVFAKFYHQPEVVTSRLVGWRYFYVPIVMLLWTALSLVWTARPIPILVGSVASVFIISSAMQNFERDRRQTYSDWQEKTPLIGKAAVEIKYPPGWSLHIEPDQSR